MSNSTGTPEVKEQVRQFYDQVGWQVVEGGNYQNARYEDLRPVSAEYIQRCHMRVKRWLAPQGKILLDVGSGPVQYAEYLTYSEGYRYRLCADLSIVALKEARHRLGERGMYVVSDAANLPFCNAAFDGVVSLHTFHHIPSQEQKKAYQEVRRVLDAEKSAVIVNGWTDSPLMRHSLWLVHLMENIGSRVAVMRGKQPPAGQAKKKAATQQPTGTFIAKQDAAWLKGLLAGTDFEIRVWRSVNVRFLRAVVHSALLGKLWLKILFSLEEKFPRWFGENGQYPLVILRK